MDMANHQAIVKRLLNGELYSCPPASLINKDNKLKEITPELHKSLMYELTTRSDITCRQIDNCVRINHITDFHFEEIAQVMLSRPDFEEYEAADEFLEECVYFAVKRALPVALEWTLRRGCKPRCHNPQPYAPYPNCGCPDCLERLETLGTDKYIKGSLALAASKLLNELDEKELGQIFWAHHYGEFVDILFYDPQQNAVWVRSNYDEVLLFDGKNIIPAPIKRFSFNFNDASFLNENSKCDDRVVLWGGKYKHRLVQRYGRSIIYFTGTHTPTIGYEPTLHCWLELHDEAEAVHLFEAMSSPPPGYKRLDSPWNDPQKGVMIRRFNGFIHKNSNTHDNKNPDMQSWHLGVNGNALVDFCGDSWYEKSYVKTLKEFESHEKAVEYYERLELMRLKNGIPIWALHFEKPKKEDVV